MNTHRYRAWRFAHPDFDLHFEESGLSISVTGGIEMIEEETSVRQAVLLLLSTMPGERVMRPDYGCDLMQLVFSPNDDTTAGLAIHYIRQAINRWEPRIEVVRLDAGRSDDDPGCLDIFLEYRLVATRRQDHLVLSLNLLGETS